MPECFVSASIPATVILLVGVDGGVARGHLSQVGVRRYGGRGDTVCDDACWQAGPGVPHLVPPTPGVDMVGITHTITVRVKLGPSCASKE